MSRPRRLMMRATSQTGNTDWFRIVNKASDDKSEATDIYIYDEIGFWGTEASEFVKKLLLIETDKINLHLNSPGGEIFDGIAIYNALKMHKAEITVIIDSLAASAASFIAQAGDKIHMQRNATMMIHDGLALVYGNEQDMLETAGVLSMLSNNVADIYAQRAGGTVAEWRAMMQAETWYNAQEAVEAGLADLVLDSEDQEAEKAKNKWDLSIFNHAGRKEAPSPVGVRQNILNRAKEAPVATGNKLSPPALNSENPPVEDAPPSDEPVETDDQGTESTPESDQPKVTGDTTPANQTRVGFIGSDSVSNTVSTATWNGPTQLFQFSINGKTTSDFNEVQKYINSVEASLQDVKNQSRKNFVQSLAEGPAPKIAASNLEELETFALGLSDEQYEAWKKSWDFVPANATLMQHGTLSGGTPDNKELNDEIETLEATLKYNRQGGMTEDEIKATSTYARLQKLRGNSEES